MDRIVDTREYLDQMLPLLGSVQKNIPLPVTGTSMAPFLHPGDTVYLTKPTCSLSPGDIVLYRRSDGSYILHRIIRLGIEGIVWITGDNQTVLEPVQAQQQIVAKVITAKRNGRILTTDSLIWRFYQTVWRWLRPLRPFLGKLHNITKAH